MPSREDKKYRTRMSLKDAALHLVEQGHNFSSISLREVAKNAGVVPTSFYRHFNDMEELGLTIVDDLGLVLRKLLRAARQQEGHADKLTRESIEVFVEFVCSHKRYFYFMCQCYGGGTLALRNAIRSELRYIAQELASDIRQNEQFRTINSADLEIVAQLTVSSVSASTIDLLDQSENSPLYREEFIERTVKQLRIIWLGAIAWRSA